MTINTPDFFFQNGQLWTSIEAKEGWVGLIDTGTTTSVFPADWEYSGIGVKRSVSTTFGKRQIALRRIEDIVIGGASFSGNVLVDETRYPIVGNDYIFRRDKVMISRDGLLFEPKYDIGEAVQCAPLFISEAQEDGERLITSLYFILNIDGLHQQVLFDTGRKPMLEATAAAVKPEKPLFPRLDLVYSAIGDWRLMTYLSRKASLSIGSEVMTVPYRHYLTNYSITAPFVMGAGILKKYSILIDIGKRRACFFNL